MQNRPQNFNPFQRGFQIAPQIPQKIESVLTLPKPIALFPQSCPMPSSSLATAGEQSKIQRFREPQNYSNAVLMSLAEEINSAALKIG